MITAAGALEGTPPFEPGFRRQLCLNSPFVGFLKAHLAEIVEAGADRRVVPRHRRLRTAPAGTAWTRWRSAARPVEAVRQKFGAEVTRPFRSDMTAYIRTLSSDCTIFYNAGHVDPEQRRDRAFTHVEIESLPSGAWGYLHFPLTVRYARNLGPDFLGMTGKFHTSWGDFHSYKNRAALEFECFHMLAHTAKCSIGDQLHPSGKIDAATYDLIGAVYAQVEKKEPWCRGARPMVDIGVFSPEEFVVGRTTRPRMGVIAPAPGGRAPVRHRRLAETTLALQGAGPARRDPRRARPSRRSCEAFVPAGGALLASYRSGLDGEGGLRPRPSASPQGQGAVQPRFRRAERGDRQGAAGDRARHVPRRAGGRAAAGAEVLAGVVAPYFNRTWEHYSSHRHTPSAGRRRIRAWWQRARDLLRASDLHAVQPQRPALVQAAGAERPRHALPEPLRVEAPSTRSPRSTNRRARSAGSCTCCTTCPSGAASTST